MKKVIRAFSFFLTVLFILNGFGTMSVQAGDRTISSTFSDGSGGINNIEWNVVDENIICEDGKLVIPAATSTDETRFISKTVAMENASVTNIVAVESALRLTTLPEGEQFIYAFGLGNIEAYAGENGNVEIIFTNDGGIKLSVIAYGAEGKVTLVDKVKCGVTLKSKFSLSANITSTGVLRVIINGLEVCNKQLPVSGKGRFGILQTGSCGAEISKLVVKCSYYDRPENVNIDEDFEDGEFNANVLVSTMHGGNGNIPAGVNIEDYDGNKVLMFRNAGLAFFGTLHEFSNFEVTFDIPYFQHEDLYDEEGELIKKASGAVCFGFGEESAIPAGESYMTDTDFFLLGKDFATSWVRNTWNESFTQNGWNLCDAKKNEGYSVKFTLIDGEGVLQAKPLAGGTYVTIAEDYYDTFRNGYIHIWSSGNSNFAIDNFKLVNLDDDPNLIDVKYESSVITVQDYELTTEDTAVVYREDIEEKNESNFNPVTYIVGCVVLAVVIITIGIAVGSALKRKTQKTGGAKNEKE